MPKELFETCNLFQQELLPATAHDGKGEISFKRLITKTDIKGACNFMDYTIMKPGTTIGEHTHSCHEEEYYLILSGQGRMKVGDNNIEVTSGDLIRNPPGGTHSLANIGQKELHIFVFELQVGT